VALALGFGAGMAVASSGVAGTVRTPGDTPVRVAPHGKARISLLARGEEAFVGRLELAPGAAVPTHRDPTEEYIVVLEGSGEMTMDGQTFPVTKGTAVYMPAHAEVSFRNGDAPMVALQVFADPGPADKYEAWTAVVP
jgi:quercetin dioxygenase-like cupin family protein